MSSVILRRKSPEVLVFFSGPETIKQALSKVVGGCKKYNKYTDTKPKSIKTVNTAHHCLQTTSCPLIPSKSTGPYRPNDTRKQLMAAKAAEKDTPAEGLRRTTQSFGAWFFCPWSAYHLFCRRRRDRSNEGRSQIVTQMSADGVDLL